MAADSPLAVFPSIDQMAETEAPEVAAVGVGAPGVGAPGVGAPAAEAGPTLAERANALKEPPYSDETLAKMGDFFMGRKRDVKSFFYTATGDLEIKEGATMRKKGRLLQAGVIQLKRFLPLEAEERAALDDARLEDLAEVEQRFEEATQRLRDAWANHTMAVAAGGSTGSEVRAVVAANQQVAELDAERNAIRSALRIVTAIKNPVTRDILLEEFYETRKLIRESGADKNVYRLAMMDLKLEHFYGKYVPDEAVVAAEAAAEDEEGLAADEAAFRTKLKDGRIARIFFDTGKSPVNDPLSPFWPVKLQIRETQYNSPLQAYEAERAKEFKKDTLRESIMKATSTRTIRLLTRAETAEPANARGLWNEIYTAVAQQHPEWKASLLATGTDALVYADPREGSSGIGVDAASPDALDPTKWKKGNHVGIVLESLRTQLREDTLEEAPTGEVKEAAITEEQAQANRVGAIVNATRRRNGGF